PQNLGGRYTAIFFRMQTACQSRFLSGQSFLDFFDLPGRIAFGVSKVVFAQRLVVPFDKAADSPSSVK
ncbi:MAG: hypothetical protein LC730_05445, partial [Acidobacteria bacterium]|nr:hypothetical protein [Acidobacteriota bacterium]